MATQAQRDTAKKNWERYEKCRDDTREWRERRDRCKQAYFGNQWDSRVSTRIRDRGQVDGRTDLCIKLDRPVAIAIGIGFRLA